MRKHCFNMPKFEYVAQEVTGRQVSGTLEAGSMAAAKNLLITKYSRIIALKKEGLKLPVHFSLSFGRIRPKNLVVFSRQFSVLISASITLVTSLKLLIDQTENPKLKQIVNNIANEVDGGARLSDTLAKYPDVFSNFYVNVIRSGESSGKLDEVLNYLADELEKDYDMMSKIKGAMIYPAFILSALGGVGVFMIIFIVPKLTEMLKESGAELPLATKLLMGVSDALANYWWLILLLLVGAIVVLKLAMKSVVVKNFIDVALLKLPIFGNLFKRIYLVRFTRSLQTLIMGGVNISKGLAITSEIVTNHVFKSLIEETKKEVEDGNSISSAFSRSDAIPTMVAQMMNIGEKSGRLDMVLGRISDFYTREINNIVNNLMTLMEPLIMILLGLGVGVMVAAIMMPMYNMGSSMG